MYELQKDPDVVDTSYNIENEKNISEAAENTQNAKGRVENEAPNLTDSGPDMTYAY